MRTLIFATKQHIEYIDKFNLFFKPFMSKDLVLVEWNPDAKNLEEAVPDIYKALNGAREWRAVVFYEGGEELKHTINPFDVVQYSDVNEILSNENLSEHKQAYDNAAHSPLTRLATFLCEHPLDTSTRIPAEKKEDFFKEDDKQIESKIEIKARDNFNLYKELAEYKAELREKIMDTGVLKAELPVSVHCISLRTIRTAAENDEENIELAWKDSKDLLYRKFTDSNMYFDGMRFFVYDIFPENHMNYKYEYLKFLYTLLIFAGNELPSGSTQPSRLYVLESQCREEKLKNMITEYIQKLDNTIEAIENRIEDIEGDVPGPMTDREAESRFQTFDTIQVNYSEGFQTEVNTKLKADQNAFGLSDLCPEKETVVWGDMYSKSSDTAYKLLKQPPRGLEKAVDDLKNKGSVSDNNILGLNHFQAGDIEEYVNREEEKMINIETEDFYDTRRYMEQIEQGDKNVRDVLATRMTKKITLILGFVCLASFVIGFIPFFAVNRDLLGVLVPIGLLFVCLVILGAVCFIYLFVLRNEVRSAVENYNEIVLSIKSKVDSAMTAFGDYLSSACRVLRGNSILNATRQQDNVFKQRVRMLRGHIEQIREKQLEIYDLFGEYCFSHSSNPDIKPYAYSFEREMEFDYPLEFTGDEVRIPYLEDINTVTVPFDFVDAVTMRMEEIYE